MEYKMIARLGLNTHQMFDEARLSAGRYTVVLAADLEKLLSEAPVVKGWRDKDSDSWLLAEDKGYSKWQREDITHSGLFLGIQPIVKDTAESLLKEYVGKFARMGVQYSELEKWHERAKALLGGEK